MGWRDLPRELIERCCWPKDNSLGGSEVVKAALESGCWHDECHCRLVVNAWRGAKAVGGIRIETVRSEVIEERWDAWRAKSEERAFLRSW